MLIFLMLIFYLIFIITFRLNLLGSCEAHVFKLEDGKWVDLTGEPVLVHLIRDNLEGMTKMLAVYTHKARSDYNNIDVFYSW